jgi:hypothetical protein
LIAVNFHGIAIFDHLTIISDTAVTRLRFVRWRLLVTGLIGTLGVPVDANTRVAFHSKRFTFGIYSACLWIGTLASREKYS